MNWNFQRSFRLAFAGLWLAANLFAADTNAVSPASVAAPHDEMAANYLQIQEQIHATQIAIEKAQQAAASVIKNNADALAGRLQALEQSVAAERAAEADAARRTQQWTLLLAGLFGLAGLGILLLMVYLQWRAFAKLAEFSASPALLHQNGHTPTPLAAPGRAVVESANAQLLNVVSQLEKRINELENNRRLLLETGVSDAKPPADRLETAQKFLDAGQPQRALELLEKFLAAEPEHAGALVKKAVALEKLGRTDEALAGFNRAILLDSSLAIAHLHKGGLLNRLRRYDEALQCYEDALRSQEKKARV
jgi:tetratricopeptide (TPR) repeat protein